MAKANDVPISPVPTIAIVVKESSGKNLVDASLASHKADVAVCQPENLSYTIYMYARKPRLGACRHLVGHGK